MTGDAAQDSPDRALGRNDRCHCGSGKKYKQCCLGKDEAAAREARAQQAEAEAQEAPASEEASPAEEEAHGPQRKSRRDRSQQSWRQDAQGAVGSKKRTLPRKVGSS